LADESEAALLTALARLVLGLATMEGALRAPIERFAAVAVTALATVRIAALEQLLAAFLVVVLLRPGGIEMGEAEQ
jgi:hypothetical protein